jgi:hypothetical protein
MTPEQREHARLWKKFGAQSRLLDTKRSVFISGDLMAVPPTKNLADVAYELTCTSDVVALGDVTALKANPTEDGRFIFTDYNVRLVRIFKAPPSLRLQPEHNVTVTRPGGELRVDGAPVVARINLYPFLTIGQRYLLVLKYLSASGALQSDTHTGTFRVTGTRAKNLSSLHATDADLSGAGIATDRLFPAVAAAAARCK